MNREERYHHWLQLAVLPPEVLANHSDSAGEEWIVVTAEGDPPDRQHHMARLASSEDLPYFAFALAKSYLEDVGEWPLFGMKAEDALASWEESSAEPREAVRTILASVHPVWPDVELLFAGPAREWPGDTAHAENWHASLKKAISSTPPSGIQ
ncbi:MAG: hypothetical protein HQL56_01400 [Magnetococcales bacterium]|nr:hypothetical protein [Magnetococcales bacterium]